MSRSFKPRGGRKAKEAERAFRRFAHRMTRAVAEVFVERCAPLIRLNRRYDDPFLRSQGIR